MNLSSCVSVLENHDLLSSLEEDLGIAVGAVRADSRKIKDGDIFVAITGEHVDGHDFINSAVSQGAAAVVGEKDLALEIPYLQVKDSRKAWAVLCAEENNNPQKKLEIIGVTGTDGKTTTAHLIQSMLIAGGYRTGLVSTVTADLGGEEVPSGLHVTTPEPPQLFTFLRKMVENNCAYAVLETTSHGLDQERVFGIHFALGVLTNITKEHLDYHQTFENYKKAKAKLFQRSAIAVLNVDDPSYEFIAEKASGKVVPYSLEKNLGFKGDLDYDQAILPGKYNESNVLAAATAVGLLGVEEGEINEGLANFSSPEGRFQEIDLEQPFKVIVDFAHTPNALENLLRTVQSEIDEGRLITVFGCAGERDSGKRFLMGKNSGKLADISIFTAEDPRGEDIEDILEEMVRGAKDSGAEEAGSKKLRKKISENIYVKIPDREEAISFAIDNAQEGDWVFILGKGHEQSMNIGGKEYEWSDIVVAKEAIEDVEWN
ncbi:MAG: UDP-N-acetylmuramoyl-L-alanyl-D-glutamate--2,6-diaminopimelate ligase, partial [Patescibacteria group bacterium]